MYDAFLCGLIAGLILTLVFHLAYALLYNRPKLQLGIFLGAQFLVLLPGVFFGLIDLQQSDTPYYLAAHLKLTAAYTITWLLVTSFGFLVPRLFFMKN